jgi:hypothetical protein
MDDGWLHTTGVVLAKPLAIVVIGLLKVGLDAAKQKHGASLPERIGRRLGRCLRIVSTWRHDE